MGSFIFNKDNFNNIENCAETRNDQRWNDANCYVNQGQLFFFVFIIELNYSNSYFKNDLLIIEN